MTFKSSQSGFAPMALVVIVFMAALISVGGYLIYKGLGSNLTITFSTQKSSPTPSIMPTASPTSSPSATPTASPSAISKPTPKPTPSCVQVKTSGMFDNDPEFSANKCYTQADASQLTDLINQYNNAVFNYNSASGQANVTCQGFTTSFQQQCDQAKQNLSKYQSEIDQLKPQMHAIIDRGQ